MRSCYVLPGICGSELFSAPTPTGLLWVNYARLVVGDIGPLRLAPDGISPGAPDGLPLTTGGPLTAYYLEALVSLGKQLGYDQYTVRGYAYDWRLEIIHQGELLAADVRKTVTVADPCTIVGHSQGGLVARAAWADLVRTGQTALVRRMITLGTPHQGSYAAVQALSLTYEAIQQLADVSKYAARILSAVTHFPFLRPWTVEDLSALAASWPAIYELMPTVTPSSVDYDPARRLMFMPANWPRRRLINFTWLNFAGGPWRRFLADPSSIPPGQVLTTVAGDGFNTVNRLGDVARLGFPGFEGGYDLGDGTVTKESALIAASARYLVPAQHRDILNAVVAGGQLVPWILSDTPQGDPLALPAALPAVYPSGMAGPPLPGPGLPGPGLPRLRGG